LAFGLAMRRGKMEETSARIARKWILAVTLVVLLLLALDVVKIPLTAFAFLGGAIAIGAGFGMQTLLKNLISGVMLLMERPFKPRDIVEVGGIRGEVTDINVRSCTIRDVNGIETLVPNSTFLEQNVTNWTLSSRKVRYALTIGVGYGSPVRKVSELLLDVAKRHKQVLDEPAPEVLFMDFGDNALMFALYVWLEVGPGRRGGNVILSDLRFMIDASFAEHGIEIPFPQRTVHVDVETPLAVRVVPPETPPFS
jgi:small-conductance mechanosensitive channel